MFNMMGEEPPIVMISVNRLKDGMLKDTAVNILRTGEFVVHLPDEAIAEKMHHCGERLPPDRSELASSRSDAGAVHACVAPPRIAEAPVAFECTLWETLETDEPSHLHRHACSALHARDALIDTDTWRVRLQDYFPVARFGASFYVTTRDRFTIG